MIHLSQRPSVPAYYIEDLRILANLAAPNQLTVPTNKLPCYNSSSNNCDVIRSLTPVGNDCQQGGQECSSQCTTTQEQECSTEYEQVCRNINEQVSTI